MNSANRQTSLEERAAEAFGRLIPLSSRVLVGYSGGADSTCLLHLLAQGGFEVVAGHLHHGQRAEADGEQRLCEAFAEELGVQFLSGRAAVPEIAQAMKISLEEAGRHARYEFFRRAAFELRCDLVATAHTKTDLAETVLLNVCRGTGLTGLAGIPERRDNIVRPLLAVSRGETRRYCDDRALWFHDDPANSDDHHSRSRIRNHVFPHLRAVNPAVEDAMARLAELATEEDRFLNGMAAGALERAEIPLNGQLAFLTADAELRFAMESLGGLPPVLFRRAIRLAVEAMGGSLDRRQTQIVESGVARRTDGSVTPEGGEVAVEWTDNYVHVRRIEPSELYREVLTVPGEIRDERNGWIFTVGSGRPGGIEMRRDALHIEVEETIGSLYVRPMAAGDRMQPVGFEGRRKVSDLLAEAGLTPMARSRLPILCDLLGPIWAPGVCFDARVQPKPTAERILSIRFAGLGSGG